MNIDIIPATPVPQPEPTIRVEMTIAEAKALMLWIGPKSGAGSESDELYDSLSRALAKVGA